MKDKTTALILSALLGGLGVDRFYLGYTGIGVLKLLTGGLFGVLWIIDIINIATGKLGPADGSGYSTDSDIFCTSTPAAAPRRSTVDELKALKELYDMGVLTEDEFNLKKTELLNKM